MRISYRRLPGAVLIPAFQDGPFSTSTNKRHLPRVTALPQLPDVGQLKVPLKDQSERVVIVSMYEVYNDRIFDLLSPSGITQGSTMSRQGKERRRPLLFKPTEQSPDRKVVAGLRKVVCASYEEAMMVLETGLTERRIAGTGSNSVSSRSHGFFCLEVKRKVRGRKHGETSWVGHSLTVVDLAGECVSFAHTSLPILNCQVRNALEQQRLPAQRWLRLVKSTRV